MPLRVLLADDHAMFREGLRSLLERERFEVVGEASDGKEAIRLAKEFRPDAAVLDLAMPRMGGLDAGLEIRKVSPKTKTILLTMHSENQYLLQALRAGFKGCVLKTHAATELVRAIRDVCQGDGVYLSPDVSKVVLDAYLTKSDLPPDPLSPRERQVLRLIADGHSTKETAAALGLSVKTAESHRARIKEKLCIRDTAGLVRYAIKNRMIQP